MRKTAFVVLFLIFIFSLQAFAEEVSLTLDEAVAIALRDNRDIRLRTEEVKKAKAKISEARGALWPSLNFTGGYTYTTGLSEKRIGLTTTQTTFKYPLFESGKIVNTIKYNRFNMEATQAVLDKTKLEIILNLKKAFFTLLLASDYAQLNKKIVENTQAHLDYLQARYREGEVSESEILNIKDSLASVQQAYETSLNQVEASVALLRNILYLDNAVMVKPEADFSYDQKDIIYDEAFLTALKKRPEIQQYEAQRKAAQKGIEITKAGTRPSIYASWSYYSRSASGLFAGDGAITGASSTATRAWNDYQTLGFTFSWPVFDGWATRAKVEQAIVELKETQLLKEKTIKDIALELKNAYLDLKNAIVSIRAVETDAVFYKNNLDVAGKQKDAGIASLLDFDDADLKFRVSAFKKDQAVYDYIIAKSNFDKAIGGM
ncbi:MAG: TolC family protein [Candidatus Omnitrophica bacterium]|nr:TolC family protein [Candidatus Omnitrophota bacterium]